MPLLPWLGVLWFGTLVGGWWLREASSPPAWKAVGLWSALAWLGRRSLWVYMLHQPLLMAVLSLVKAART